MRTPAAPRPSSSRRSTTPGLRVGSVAGAPIVLTRGWALIAVVLVVLFTPIVQSRLGITGLLPAGAIALAIPLLLALSVLAHELAHGLTARRAGYDVDEFVISLWGGHTSFARDIDRPGASALVAVVGPLANAAIAVACWWAVMVTPGHAIGFFLLTTIAITNAVVAVFNLVPALPLDGGRLLEALIWKITGDRYLGMRISGRCGQVAAVLIAVGVLGWPLLSGRRPELTTAIWGILIAGVIWQGAAASVRVARARARAADFDVHHFLRPARLLPEAASVADVQALPTLVLDASGRPLGVVDGAALAAVPGPVRAGTPVTAVLDASAPVAVMTETAGPAALGQLAQILQHRSGNVTVVMRDGAATAIVDVTAVIHRLETGG
ncbi:MULTISPECIES: site-2 protease family protein [unclassified Pseudactinotalea]|uniref:site-2 protease family protein n=1 Tax=unclassified Pseudactinotalea TaxID=2649176 RepID=UPI00128CB43E|nr:MULTISPECIES: site-2 protease family protein [unclassified Pseudactinotalea]MPV49901.1 peptidase M50 [Pseudactinotalea sp. HY160]QGH69162.1 peptidase M50 [Pseudactinotalea sp. HY158]